MPDAGGNVSAESSAADSGKTDGTPQPGHVRECLSTLYRGRPETLRSWEEGLREIDGNFDIFATVLPSFIEHYISTELFTSGDAGSRNSALADQ